MIEALIRFIFKTVAAGKRKALERDLARDPAIAQYIRDTDEAAARIGGYVKNMEDRTRQFAEFGSEDDEDDEVEVHERNSAAIDQHLKGKARPKWSDGEFLAEIAKLRAEKNAHDQLLREEEQKSEAHMDARDAYLDEPNGEPSASWVPFDDTDLRRLQMENRQLQDLILEYMGWRLRPDDSQSG